MINEILFRVLILVTPICAKAKFDIVRDFFKTLGWEIMSFTNFSRRMQDLHRISGRAHLSSSELKPLLPLVFKFKHGGLLLWMGFQRKGKKTPSVPSSVYFEKFSFPKVLTKGDCTCGKRWLIRDAPMLEWWKGCSTGLSLSKGGSHSSLPRCGSWSIFSSWHSRGHLAIIQPLSREQNAFPSLFFARLTFDKLALMLILPKQLRWGGQKKFAAEEDRRERNSRFSKQCQKADFLSLLQTPGNEYKWMEQGLF